jgi:hypothetical protein
MYSNKTASDEPSLQFGRCGRGTAALKANVLPANVIPMISKTLMLPGSGAAEAARTGKRARREITTASPPVQQITFKPN